MHDASLEYPGGIALQSAPVAPQTLAELVADALARDDSLNRTTLARQARMTPKTLRDILDATPRRYGEATLRGLDDALGWERGTAWRAYQRDNGHDDEVVADHLDRVDAQYAELLERLARLEEQPTWVDEIIAIGRLLSPGDRRAWIDLGHRLTRA